MALVVGGIGDVVHIHPRLHEKAWKAVSTGLPHAFFFDVHYNEACDALVAGALGRGAWTVTSPFKGGSSANCPPTPPAAAAAATAAATQVTAPSDRAPQPPISLREKGK